MKKILKSRLFFFILGVVISSGVATVFAFSVFAPEVGYTARDEMWEVDNVKEALDDLRKHYPSGEVAFVAQYTTYLTGYMFDLPKGEFYSAGNGSVSGRTMSLEWTGNSYIVKALVSGRFLISWNYDSNIVECNAGDTIYTFNRQNNTVFTSIGLINYT